VKLPRKRSTKRKGKYVNKPYRIPSTYTENDRRTLADEWRRRKKTYNIAGDGRWIGEYVPIKHYGGAYGVDEYKHKSSAVNRADKIKGFKKKVEVYESVGSFPEHRRLVYERKKRIRKK
jgi:hypothetical protein